MYWGIRCIRCLSYLVDGKLGACGYLLERDIPVLAVPLEDHVHEAQKGDLLLREGRAAHQRGLRRHRLRTSVDRRAQSASRRSHERVSRRGGSRTGERSRGKRYIDTLTASQSSSGGFEY